MELLKAVANAIRTVIEWIANTITALFDWGWTGPSEWIIIFIVIAIIIKLVIKFIRPNAE